MYTLDIRKVVPGAGVPIAAKTRTAILEKSAEIKTLPVDIVEWRADFYEDLFNIPELLETLKALRTALGDTPILLRSEPNPKTVKLLPVLRITQALILQLPTRW